MKALHYFCRIRFLQIKQRTIQTTILALKYNYQEY